jgi:hypothetical protein
MKIPKSIFVSVKRFGLAIAERLLKKRKGPARKNRMSPMQKHPQRYFSNFLI